VQKYYDELRQENERLRTENEKLVAENIQLVAQNYLLQTTREILLAELRECNRPNID